MSLAKADQSKVPELSIAELESSIAELEQKLHSQKDQLKQKKWEEQRKPKPLSKEAIAQLQILRTALQKQDKTPEYFVQLVETWLKVRPFLINRSQRSNPPQAETKSSQ